METPPAAAPAEPTQEERLQEQLAAQLQLPGLDTSAPAPRAPALQHAKVPTTLSTSHVPLARAVSRFEQLITVQPVVSHIWAGLYLHDHTSCYVVKDFFVFLLEKWF